MASYNKLTAKDYLNFAPYSFEVTNYRAMNVRVELDDTPQTII